MSRLALGTTQHPNQGVSGTFSLGVKRPRREAIHSPPSSAEAKNAWGYTFNPQYAFMAQCQLKHRDNFSFIFSESLVLIGRDVPDVAANTETDKHHIFDVVRNELTGI